MAGGGRGRVIGAVAALARLAMAIGIGCLVFSAAVALVLADRATPATPELAAGLGLLGALWTSAGLVAEGLVRLADGRGPKPTAPVPPSWHNQPSGRGPRHSRPRRVPVRQPQTGWWTVLGVAADAPRATCESAARSLLRQCHPDRWATAEPVLRQQAEGRTRTILQALAEARASAR
ncbi:hypothetical protein PK98_12245 [Croceibacterium mercuriale]|uniref:J domain-containing protein n=1 Tax=Croceibacterium mercuriale TaxID=1572751 RepID=A0A0B2BTH1_9SPHN|nr:J domain-containing protein [Croceibacterium mercuriale]KHL24704.1 hypothetical protein PK98_12245 [Croceibacterium mercuriale]